MSDYVTIEKRDGIAILTLNRPDKLNAIGNHADCEALVGALRAVDADPDIRVGILTGAGRAFCAGGDLKGMKERNGIGPLDSPAATRRNYKQGIQQVPLAFRDIETPMIAAINGHAIGVGLDIACLCDVRIAAEDARFAASFIKVGLVPGDGGAWVLPRVVGYARAAEMLLTGEPILAAEALACGLVSRVVPADALVETALDLAGRMAANPAQALRMTRRLLIKGQTASFEEVLDMSAAMQALAHETRDHAEAVDAFLERRPPRFTGG